MIEELIIETRGNEKEHVTFNQFRESVFINLMIEDDNYKEVEKEQLIEHQL